MQLFQTDMLHKEKKSLLVEGSFWGTVIMTVA
jgi:hypothetical protein